MAEPKFPLESTTRTFDTVKGKLTYSELADLIAPNLLKLLDEISDDRFANRVFDEDFIKEIHHRIIGDIMPSIAGKWRQIPVYVGNWFPPEPYELPVLMREYTRNIQTRLQYSDSLILQVESLAYAEGEFLHIHPFQDFNGRTIRILLAELMMRFDIPRVDTSVARGTPAFRIYQNALAEYDNGRLHGLMDFWQMRLNREI